MKKTVLTAALVLFVGGLVGCGDTTTAKSTPAPAPAAGKDAKGAKDVGKPAPKGME